MSRETGTRKGIDRRTWIRAAVAGSAGLGLAGAALRGPLVGGEGAAGPVALKGCVGCTGCAAVCPVDAIDVRPGGVQIDATRCVRCGYCAAVCPVAAVRIAGGAGWGARR